MEKQLKGSLITILGGACWGFSGACGQFLFNNYTLDPIDLTAIRMISAGILLTFYNLFTQKKVALNIFKSKKDVLHLLAFGLLGLIPSQFTYLTAIKYSNAGTATVLEYTGPVLIMIYVSIKTLKWPKRKEVMAVFLAILGTFLLATGGNVHNMVLSKEGLIWGLLSAVCVALYTLIPGELVKKWGSLIVTGYSMLISGGVISLVFHKNFIPGDLEFYGTLAIMAIVLIGTILAYTLYLKGVSLIGPVKASMLASVEPVVATVLSIVWLKTAFYGFSLIGIVCIILTVFLLGKKENKQNLKGLEKQKT